MPNVALSDDLYRETARLADAHGMSVDEYVAQTLQAGFEDDDESPLMLTPEQMAIVRRSQAEIRAGQGMTMDQAEEWMAQRKAERLQTHPL